MEWLGGGDKPTVKVLVESNLIAFTLAVSSGSVQTDIENVLRRLTKTDAAGIAVSLKGSDITLSGKVASWAKHNAARDSAWATPGVSSVVDDMTVGI